MPDFTESFSSLSMASTDGFLASALAATSIAGASIKLLGAVSLASSDSTSRRNSWSAPQVRLRNAARAGKIHQEAVFEPPLFFPFDPGEFPGHNPRAFLHCDNLVDGNVG